MELSTPKWTFKQFMDQVIYTKLYATTSPDLERRRQIVFDEFIQYFGKKNLEKLQLMM